MQPLKYPSARSRAYTLRLALALGLAGPAAAQAEPTEALTFHRDIAPLVIAKCATCHHPGEAAPFSLISYADVRKRAGQIAIVTESRFMPPWLPIGEQGVFQHDRSLTDAELNRLQRWIDGGAIEGDASDAAAPPAWSDEWQLGEPDLVARMSASYTLAAEGRDVYRNFVIRAPLAESGETRYVRAVEFRPDNRTVVHHAVMFVDGSGVARQLDRSHPQTGYPDMGLGALRIPDGQFVGWTPGKTPSLGTEGISWRLDPFTDLVLQLHLRPTGKSETVSVELGLHFADAPPTSHPMGIRLSSDKIDIPAEESAYVVEASYTLPVDVRVLGIYPHAHYLGKDMSGFAVLPDGSRRDLIQIDAWDFNWQEEYVYREAIALPKGTVLGMRYVFDNSSSNLLNPSIPPKRVVFGQQSTDEMAELLLSVLPATEDRPRLWRDFIHSEYEVTLARLERKAAAEPNNPAYFKGLATHCQRLGRTAEAVAYYEQLVERTPGRPNPLQRLGQARLLDGDVQGAVRDLEATLEISPAHVRTLIYLGIAYGRIERFDEALEALGQARSRDRSNPLTYVAIGEVQAKQGALEIAADSFVKALSINPEHTRALWNLAQVRLDQGDADAALRWSEGALHISPDNAAAHAVHARTRAARGEHDLALMHFTLAVDLDPNSKEFERELARARENSPTSPPR